MLNRLSQDAIENFFLQLDIKILCHAVRNLNIYCALLPFQFFRPSHAGSYVHDNSQYLIDFTLLNENDRYEHRI